MLLVQQQSGIPLVRLASARDLIFEGDDENLGIIPALIGLGLSAVPIIKGLFSACKPGQACGLKEIQSFVDQVLQTLAQIQQMLETGLIDPSQAVAEAQRVSAALSDPTMIYQAKNGKDAAALANGKTQAAAAVQQIMTLAAQIVTSPAAPADASGITAGSGVSSSTLLIGGAAVLAAILLLD